MLVTVDKVTKSSWRLLVIGILSTKVSWRQLQFYPQNHRGYNWNSIHKIIMETIGILPTKSSWR